MGRFLLRLRATIYRVQWILSFFLLWIGVGIAAFHWYGGLNWTHSFLSAVYLEVQPGIFSQGYAFWGQSLLFGFVVAALLRETLENHIERCRLMAGFMKDHTIIVGYTHLGMRLVDHCIQNKTPYVLIEKNRELVDDLLRKNEPVIVDDARSKDALPAANVRAAKRLIIASNNVETALIVTKNTHDANPQCKIMARCPMDDLVGILERLGAGYVYSASLAAFNDLAKHLVNEEETCQSEKEPSRNLT